MTDENKSSGNKTKIELGILAVLVVVAICLGIPAYQSYQNLEKAIAIFAQGDECLHKNDIPGARAKFEECIKIYPELRGAYEELAAIAYFEENNLEKACQEYERGLQVMPDSAELYLSYAQMMFAAQNYEKARDMAQKAVDIDSREQRYSKHLDLFDRMTKDPQLVERHKQTIQQYGRAKAAADLPGAHHHHEHEDEAQSAPAEQQPAAEQQNTTPEAAK